MSEWGSSSEAPRWLHYARDDLLGADALLDREDIAPRLACFHGQQSAEKALKALLILRGVDPPKTHDLFALRALLPGDLDVGATDEELVALSKWAVGPRYPDDLPEATAEDARETIERARVIYEAAFEDLVHHGYTLESGEEAREVNNTEKEARD